MLNFRTLILARTILFGVVLSLSTTFNLGATTYFAASPRVSDIQAKVNLAHDGDTITVPAGTVSWSTPLEITKNIVVRGAGIGKTIILDEVPRSAGSFTMRIALDKDLPARLTGFEFRGSTAVAKPNPGGVIRLRGMAGITHKFRLDHCKFDNLHGLPLLFTDLTGVVDHCTVNTTNAQGMQVYHDTWGGQTFGHGSWADSPYWGTDKFLFVEDCDFTISDINRAAIDCYEGTRAVIRHNTFNNAQVSAHGTEGQGRGTKQLEIYNNTFTNWVRRNAGQIRSGSALIHDNIYKNYTRGMTLQAYRQFTNSQRWGISNGTNVWDVNNSVLVALEQGKHTGTDNNRELVDTNKNWTSNQWETVDSRKGFSYILRNTTTNRQSVILSNASHTISYFLAIPPMRFDRGDSYQIWKVVTSLDQPGQGKGNLLFDLPAQPKGWPDTVREPCYSWNNKDENGNDVDLGAFEGSIQEGRDFFNRTRKLNYAPYTYPHPLAVVP
jgi:hypothetical protein